MRLYSTSVSTPVGPFMLLAGDDGIYAAGFTTQPSELLSLLGPGSREAEVKACADLSEHSRAVAAYFGGEIAAIDEIAVVQQATPYLLAAWAALRDIPAGAPITYRDLAARLGNAAAPRAAGSACGRNTVAVIVPCHRVLRTDGGLGGFGWGLPVKRWLLQHEAGAAQSKGL
ncbi:MAG: cysteine methyltransferase [Chloroflexi bacterium]|nr:cysteine methyltransferase [Chloroflexota bacterium]